MFDDLPLLWPYLPQLLSGVAVTAEICIIAIAAGMVLGFGVALLGRITFKPLQGLVAAYVEILRGTPLLIQLFILYYGGPESA